MVIDQSNTPFQPGMGNRNLGHNNNDQLTEEQLKGNVMNIMREFLRNKKFVSKDEIFSMIQNNCSLTQLDGILNRLQQEGQIVTAHDNNHYFII